MRLEGRGVCTGCAARGETMIFVCIVCLDKSHGADVPAGMLSIWQRLFGDVVLPSSGGVENRAESMEKTFQEEWIFRLGCSQSK